MEFILRVTYGYKRKFAEVSSSELSQQIDCDSGDARRILSNLVARKMLFRVKEARGSKPAIYQINKNWESWKHGRKSPWPPLIEKSVRGIYTTEKADAMDQNPTESSGKIPRRTVGSIPRRTVSNPTETCQKSPKSVATCDTLRYEDTKINNTAPLPPQGELGGSRRSKKAAPGNAISENPKYKQMISWLETKLGHPPASHLAERTWAIVNRRTPAGWPPNDWRQNCVDTFEKCLDAAIFDLSNGKRIHSVLATANSRAEQAIAQEAMASGQ